MDTNEHIYFYGRTRGRVSGKFRFLSNFYKAKILIERKEYTTVEHYFQSQKYAGTEYEEEIRLAPTPMAAKKLAWAKQTPSSWDARKEEVMLMALRAKFSQHPDLAQKLLDTGNAHLHEDSPTDMYWGVKGLDRLGKLLMIVREELESKA